MKKLTIFLSLFFSFALTACNTSNSGDINDDQSDKTVSITNFEKTNDGFLGKIDNNIETFSFINRVNVPKNATWTIYKDVAGTVEVPTKTIECQIGDNYVYLLVNGEKESLGFYKVDVYRYDLFTVSFNTNGGNYIEPQKVQEESLAVKPDNPTRTGYTFSQWDHDFSTPIMSDKTINASWTANQYVITFDVNGGDPLSSNTMIATYGQTLTLPTPTWTGNTFLGWFNNNTQYSSGIWRTSGSLTLTAKWEVSRYTITYKVNGGFLSNSSNTQTVTYGQSYELYSASRTGYRFDGWYYGSNLFENGIWNLEQNVELDARWTANQYTITYILNNGTQSESTTQTVTYDEVYVLTTPTREGYTFDGWFDDNDKIVSGIWKRDGNLTLDAHWTPIVYSVSLSMPSSITHYYVTFDKNDGTGTYLEKEIKLGEILERPTNPTRSGYSFRAWFKEAACTTPFNFNEEITESLVLYAGWYEASAFWDVNVNKRVSVNGGSGSTASTLYFVCPYTTSYKFTATSNSSIVFKIEIVLSSMAGSNVYKSSYNGYNNTYSLSGNINPTEITFNADAGTVIYLSFTETANKNTTSFKTSLTCSFECVVPEETSTLSANAKPIPQNVTYDSNFDFGIVSYPGYTFDGWYTGPNGSGTKLTDGTGKSIGVWKSTNVSLIYAYLIPNQ